MTSDSKSHYSLNLYTRLHKWPTAYSCPWKVKVSVYDCCFHTAKKTIGPCKLDSSDD